MSDNMEQAEEKEAPWLCLASPLSRCVEVDVEGIGNLFVHGGKVVVDVGKDFVRRGNIIVRIGKIVVRMEQNKGSR